MNGRIVRVINVPLEAQMDWDSRLNVKYFLRAFIRPIVEMGTALERETVESASGFAVL